MFLPPHSSQQSPGVYSLTQTNGLGLVFIVKMLFLTTGCVKLMRDGEVISDRQFSHKLHLQNYWNSLLEIYTSLQIVGRI
jgi:hypothetical protein